MANFFQRLFTRSRRATEVQDNEVMRVASDPQPAPHVERPTLAGQTNIEPGGDLEVAVPDSEKTTADAAQPAETPASDIHGGDNETTTTGVAGGVGDGRPGAPAVSSTIDAEPTGEPLPPAAPRVDDAVPSIHGAAFGTPDATWTVAQLRDEAKKRGIAGYSRMAKADLLAVLEK